MNYSSMMNAMTIEYLKMVRLVATLKAQNDYLKGRLAIERSTADNLKELTKEVSDGFAAEFADVVKMIWNVAIEKAASEASQWGDYEATQIRALKVIISLDSKSYPYLAIAQHYKIPYEEVLEFADAIHNVVGFCPTHVWQEKVAQLERDKKNVR